MSQQLVQKLWNYCNILRDDGLSYGDYVEQLTFLLFLKMADEQSRPPFNKPSPILKGFGWDVLLKLEAVVSANLQRATRLRQSILHKAFTGQLVDLYDRKNPLTAQNKLGPPVT